MKKNDLYRKVLNVVCINTGIDEENILHSNKEVCVDARFLLVKALASKLTDNEIAMLINRTRQSVNYIRNSNRMDRWSVANNWKEISNELAKDCFSIK